MTFKRTWFKWWWHEYCTLWSWTSNDDHNFCNKGQSSKFYYSNVAYSFQTHHNFHRCLCPVYVEKLYPILSQLRYWYHSGTRLANSNLSPTIMHPPRLGQRTYQSNKSPGANPRARASSRFGSDCGPVPSVSLICCNSERHGLYTTPKPSRVRSSRPDLGENQKCFSHALFVFTGAMRHFEEQIVTLLVMRLRRSKKKKIFFQKAKSSYWSILVRFCTSLSKGLIF